MNRTKPSLQRLVRAPSWMSVMALCLSLVLTSQSVNAAQNIDKQYQIMAGFLLQLTSFTQWPALDDNKVHVCILGEDPFNGYIDAMVKRRPKTRMGYSILIDRIQESNIVSLAHCQILYVRPAYYQTMWPHLPDTHRTLLVSNHKTFLAEGGMVNFSSQSKRIKLEVNLAAVSKAQLKLSSALLKHAEIVSSESVSTAQGHR